ncbi:MAG: hypothetical protein K2X55_16485 [Burkholderiaceae bacterium]|nr:hypothetical protein [Burkholderiaceae bacterium]
MKIKLNFAYFIDSSPIPKLHSYLCVVMYEFVTNVARFCWCRFFETNMILVLLGALKWVNALVRLQSLNQCAPRPHRSRGSDVKKPVSALTGFCRF